METDNKFETILCKQCEISKSEIAQASTYTKHKQLNTWRNKIRKIKNSEGKEIRIDIPEFQRGLVWKASQIETLWDSVMRGIPIGCITLIKYKGEAKENQAEYGVFDGQFSKTDLSQIFS